MSENKRNIIAVLIAIAILLSLTKIIKKEQLKSTMNNSDYNIEHLDNKENKLILRKF